MKLNQRLNMLLVSVAAAIFATVLIAVPVARATQDPGDPAAFYKAKCVACHGQKAEKRFDSTLPDDQLLNAVMKGKKVEKPPNMPAFEDKGVTADQAKALITLMKQLKEAPGGN